VLPVVGFTHAYPRANPDERSGYRLALGQHDRGTRQQVCAVVVCRDAEGLAKVPRTPRKAWALDLRSSPLARQVLPFDDPARTDEDGRGDAVCSGDDVGAPVETVRPVDVQMSCGPEHHGVAGCPAPVGVGGRVSRTGVRLGLRDGDAHGSLRCLVGEDGAEQRRGDFFSGASEEGDVHADRLDMP